MSEAVAGASTDAAWVAGGYKDEDEHMGQQLGSRERGEHWEPDGWHKTPEQMQSEARAANQSAFTSSAAAGGKHSNPPNDPNLRPF